MFSQITEATDVTCDQVVICENKIKKTSKKQFDHAWNLT